MLFARWMVACAVGAGVGRVIVGVVADVIVPTLGLSPESAAEQLAFLRVLMLISGALEGICVGTAQWFVLRREMRIGALQWVFATSLGFALGWFLGTFIQTSSEPTIGVVLIFGALTGGALGLVTAYSQLFVLRRYPLAWVGANVAGWALAMLASLFGSMALSASDTGGIAVAVNLATGAVGGALVGGFTFAALGKLQGQAAHSNVVNSSQGPQKSRTSDPS